ncbi:hypothetical protein B0T20DRAFT_497683 [Sordaria brevicollis]|uniref:Uncharacterized protein n=1 Tax=Sordaria brevicollis TaxID=83679 RepID=A0AAE0PGC5_SORBR|nr:hypothetical protein B0T20DRAFT_497683 [Sordaria brevicollis]
MAPSGKSNGAHEDIPTLKLRNRTVYRRIDRHHASRARKKAIDAKAKKEATLDHHIGENTSITPVKVHDSIQAASKHEEATASANAPQRLTTDALKKLDPSNPPTANAPSSTEKSSKRSSTSLSTLIVHLPPATIKRLPIVKKMWIDAMQDRGLYVCVRRYDAVVATPNTICDKCFAIRNKPFEDWKEEFSSVISWVDEVKNAGELEEHPQTVSCCGLWSFNII